MNSAELLTYIIIHINKYLQDWSGTFDWKINYWKILEVLNT